MTWRSAQVFIIVPLLCKMEEYVHASNPNNDDTPKSSCRTYIRGSCLLVGLFICLVWFWHNISPCRPPAGVCGQAMKNGIQTLDLLDEAQLLTETSFQTILCGIIEAELNCLGQFFRICLSSGDKDHKFYSSLHLEGISTKQQFCGPSNNLEPASISLSSCWFAIRQRRHECVSEFLQSPGARAQVIMDSLFDDFDTGVYRKEFCWALRDAVICGLSIFRQGCGESTAKSLYHVTRNITNMIFMDKCDESLRPDWEDSTLRLMKQSFRPLMSYVLKILCTCLVFLICFLAWKCTLRLRRCVIK